MKNSKLKLNINSINKINRNKNSLKAKQNKQILSLLINVARL